jgi:YVTN family beta-propeller protein
MPPINTGLSAPRRARLRLPGSARPSIRRKQIMSTFWATRAAGSLKAAVPRVWRAPAAVTVLALPLATGAVAAASARPAVSTGYRVTATVPVDAAGTVDVNPVTDRVYVTQDADNTVSVINGRTNAVTATITGGDHPFAVAVNPLTNRAYVANFHPLESGTWR